VFASFEKDVGAGFLQVHPVADEHLIAALGLITRLGRYPLRTLDAMADAGKAAGLVVARFF
jgi:hypothetical protein